MRYPLKVCGDPMTTVRLPRKSVLYENVKLLRTDKARASCAIHLKSAETYDYRTIHARIQKVFSGGGSKFPEGVLRKISTWQKLIICQLLPGGGERSGPHVTPSGSAHAIGLRFRIGTSTKGRFRNRTMPI